MSATTAAWVAAVVAVLSLLVAAAALVYVRRATLAAEGSETASTRSATAAEVSAGESRRANERGERRDEEKAAREAAELVSASIDWVITRPSGSTYLLRNKGAVRQTGVTLSPAALQIVTPTHKEFPVDLDPDESTAFVYETPFAEAALHEVRVMCDADPGGRIVPMAEARKPQRRLSGPRRIPPPADHDEPLGGF